MGLSNRMTNKVRSTRREVVVLTGTALLGGTDVITSQDIRGAVLTAAGGSSPTYTLTLNEPYSKLLSFSADLLFTTPQGVICRPLTETVSASTKNITWHFSTSALPTTKAIPTSGSTMLIRVVLSKSKVK